MPTNLSSAMSRKNGATSWLVGGLFAVASGSVLVLCALLAIKGPEIRAAADAQQARTIDEDNRALLQPVRRRS
jgi:hypothetical protein